MRCALLRRLKESPHASGVGDEPLGEGEDGMYVELRGDSLAPFDFHECELLIEPLAFIVESALVEFLPIHERFD
jgi:hypothetical protein